LRSGVRAGPAKYSMRRTVTGFALVGLQFHVASAAELVPIVSTLIASATAVTAAALLRVASCLIKLFLLYR